jgi:hypothetical protein
LTRCIPTSTAEAEFLGVKEVSRVNVRVSQNIRLRMPSLRTSFSKNWAFFVLFFIPRLMPHNVLYDTSWAWAVKERLAKDIEIVKGSYPQDAQRICGLSGILFRECVDNWLLDKYQCERQRIVQPLFSKQAYAEAVCKDRFFRQYFGECLRRLFC